MKFNFGEEDFKFPPKDGFVALDKAPEGNSVKSQHAGTLGGCSGVGAAIRKMSYHIKLKAKKYVSSRQLSTKGTFSTFPISGSAQVAQTKNQPNAPKALIVEPSRELAEQTLNNVKQFKKYVDNPKLRYNQIGTGGNWDIGCR